MLTAERTTSSSWAHAIVDALEVGGIDGRSLLAELGLDSALLEDPDARFELFAIVSQVIDGPLTAAAPSCSHDVGELFGQSDRRRASTPDDCFGTRSELASSVHAMHDAHESFHVERAMR